MVTFRRRPGRDAAQDELCHARYSRPIDCAVREAMKRSQSLRIATRQQRYPVEERLRPGRRRVTGRGRRRPALIARPRAAGSDCPGSARLAFALRRALIRTHRAQMGQNFCTVSATLRQRMGQFVTEFSRPSERQRRAGLRGSKISRAGAHPRLCTRDARPARRRRVLLRSLGM